MNHSSSAVASRRGFVAAAHESTFHRSINTLPVLMPDLASARLFGEVKARLASDGRIVADADLFIAAIALSHGATLVTKNRKHYERIQGLAIENWLRA